ncbi:MAG: Glutamate--tRNA ligase [Candidatus Woesearchaeota archaeon]|nr:Glutamate--tRNA ligase [Candidatus Woesearchaeota archaeon]
MKDIILKYALQNAVKYEGTAQTGAVIGKVFSEQPELRKDAKSVGKKTSEIVNQVNKMSPEDQLEKLKEIAPELLEKKKEEEKGLPDLENAEMGKVVTRLPPEPSKYLHIGHVMSFMINYLMAKKYDGKCILKFEDTNPDKCTEEFTKTMQEDIKHAGIKVDDVIFISDDLEYMYEQAEKLITEGNAYVCLCNRDNMRTFRHKGLECEHGKISVKENMQNWKKMLDREFKEGEAVLRLKGDMESDNHVMRDPVLFKIDYSTHWRQKNRYCVWPLYDFENSVEDCKYGVTHILRSSEFGTMRNELQNYIKDLLGFEKQTIIHYGRINITGSITKGREIRAKIKNKEVIGWDDPRLVTVRALKRRGIDPRTYKELVYEVGLSLTPTNIDWSVVSAINRKIIDKEVNRCFVVTYPKLIKIEGAPKQKIELDLHPDFPERGKRKFQTKDEFYVAGKDSDFKEGKLYRLMDCLNFVKNDKLVFDSLDYEKFREKGDKIIHWLAKEQFVKIKIMMPNGKFIQAYAEPQIEDLKEGEVIQAQRFGFIKKDKDMEFWYTHN